MDGAICGKTFVQPSNLATHMRSHSKEICCCDFKLKNGLVCGKNFDNVYFLKVHKRIHTGEKPFICNFPVGDGICGKSFSQNSNLTTHQRAHAPEKQFVCNFEQDHRVCGKKFRYHNGLAVHRQTHSVETIFTCNFTSEATACVKTFNTLRKLKRHQECHLRTESFICDVIEDGRICGKVCKTTATLKRHKRLFHVKEKKFVCDFKKDEFQCNQKFATSDDLSRHRKTHNNGKAFICDFELESGLCGKEFTRNNNLLKHIKSHTEEVFKPFVCNFSLPDGVCKYKTDRKDHLASHQRTHSGERPFPCMDPNCDQRFSEKAHMKRHFRRWHSGDAALRHQTKEQRLANIFSNSGIVFERNRLIDYTCFVGSEVTKKTRAYLDFVIYKENHVFIVECDEHQHDEVYNPWGYTVSCEIARMGNVQMAITVAATSANGVVPKIVWIRYNPDKFFIDGVRKTVAVHRSYREKSLLNLLETFIPIQPVTIIYMYYDCRTMNGKLHPVILDREDYDSEFAKCVSKPIVN